MSGLYAARSRGSARLAFTFPTTERGSNGLGSSVTRLEDRDASHPYGPKGCAGEARGSRCIQGKLTSWARRVSNGGTLSTVLVNTHAPFAFAPPGAKSTWYARPLWLETVRGSPLRPHQREGAGPVKTEKN